MMKHSKILSTPDIKKCLLLLQALFCAQIQCQNDQPSSPTGLLGVSDCATCPVICAKPPSPMSSNPPPSPPPPHLHRPPPSPPVYYSPSQPYFRAPPPWLFPSPLPPAGSPPPPPFMYYSGGGGGGNVPTIQGPPGVGQRNYSYPYYHFYASKASSLSLQFPSIIFLLVVYSYMALSLINK